MIKKHFQYLLIALTFLTRIPSPFPITFSADSLSKASIYFPLIGILIGVLNGFIFYVLSFVLPKSIAIILSVAFTVRLTGAIHEDGFGDVCDAFGGGINKDKILTIMKDSRLGTYGVVGLILMLLTKFVSLNEITGHHFITFIAGHSISRLMCVVHIYFLKYVSDASKSKSKLLVKPLSIGQLLMAVVFGLSPLIFYFDPFIWIPILAIILVNLYLAYLFKKKIGGYTGDCLGAVQQVSELVFYIVMVSYPWKFI